LRQGAFPSRIDTEFYAPILIERQIVRDGVTYTTKYSNHDTYGNPGTISEAGPKGGTRVINITYENDPKLWLIRQVYDETTVGVGRVSTRRDTHGNVRSVTRDGVTTSYSYTSAGDVETIVRPRTLTSRYSDYHRGSPQQEQHEEGVKISRNVNSAGNVTSETNGEGATTQYEYDGLSRVTKITPPLGYPTIISYTATSKTATRGSAQEVTTFDAFARPVAITVGGQSLAAKYDSLGRKVFASHFGYPTVGNSFAYDILDRLQKVTHSADQSFRLYTHGASGGAPTLAVRDERNFTTVHTYRGYGDPDQMLLMEVDAPVSTANVSLNRNGRGLVTDYTQAGFTRRFAFDSRYYLTSTFHPEVGTTTYGRDDAGNMTSRKVGNSGSTVFEYDRRNRLKYVTYPNNNPAKVTKEYYSTDRLKSVSNGVATRVLVYDKNINLTSESIAIDGLSMEAKYRYDANDHMSAITYPVLNRVFELNPDQFGRAKTITAPTGTMLNAAYWPNGQVYEVAYAGGSRATYGQNSRGQMDSITIQTGDSVNHVASTLRRDVAGNIYRIDDTANSYTFNRGYEYDGINRLTTVNGFWGNGQVSYDGAGNIRSYTLGTMSQKAYTYDTSNRLSSVRSSDPGGALETSYSYDEYGNANLVQDEYVYDAANNMTSGPPGIRRAYDGDNVRVRSSSAGAVTYEFRSVSGALLAEWTKESGYLDILKEHLHISGKPVAEQRTHFVGTDVRTPTWMFLQHDHNGSPISATWAGGGLLFKQSYQPYGEDSDSSGGYTKLGFTGATQDTANLSYMGRRYYNPKIGRFLSIDPEEADPADIHSYNRYAYANNNPNRYVDPDGASPITLEQLARVDATVNVYQHCGNSQCIQSSLTQMVMVRDSLRADGVDLQDRSALGANIGQASMLVGQQAEVFRAVGEAGIVGLSQGASKTGPIRNAHLAGSVHPFTKIPFDKQGYPDFSSVAKATVKIAQTGNRAGDARAANKAAGYQSTPEGYQWHHHQDKTTMQLVPQWHHQKTGHDGGYTGK
jgi:RHS repeat-associated protein